MLETKTTVADTMLWERTARKHKWSLNISDNPQTWETFLGWAALRRVGQVTEGYEAFCESALEISVSIPEVEGEAEIDPIR